MTEPVSQTVDPFALSPEQATAALAEMAKTFQGAPSQDPTAKLNRLYADPAWRAKLDAGHLETRREFDALTKAAAEVDPVTAAMTGALPDLPSSELRHMSETAAYLRSLDLSEDVVKEVLSGQPTTKAIQDEARAWRDRQLKTPEYVEAFMAGEPEAVKKMTLCSIILSQPLKEDA